MRWMIWTLLTFAALIRSCPGERRRRCAQVNCLVRAINPTMIKDMLYDIEHISKSLPNDNKRRYVPKFHVKNRNIAVINKLLEIFEKHVFERLWKSEQEGPRKFTPYFSTLKVYVKRCKENINATIDQNMNKAIMSMEKAFKKLTPDELLYAAVDFQTVLNWISSDSDPKLLVNKCHK